MNIIFCVTQYNYVIEINYKKIKLLYFEELYLDFTMLSWTLVQLVFWSNNLKNHYKVDTKIENLFYL